MANNKAFLSGLWDLVFALDEQYMLVRTEYLI